MKTSVPVEIVSAELVDIPQIARLEKELNANHSWSQKTFENLLRDETCWIWVAKKEGIFAGYLVCQLIGEEAELHDIAVEKEFRRR
ncbi:MAG: GNAT family N-acetyltransferase, partial [Deltaproteobacteria bacterium]|nr:GNAT family N-acetyltransferase [Deltaproteobacteria bacterium]